MVNACRPESHDRHAMPSVGIDASILPSGCGVLRELVKESPGNAELHYRFAVCAFEADSLNLAWDEINAALELDDLNAKYSLLKSRILFEQGELAAAIEEAENAQSLDADDPAFYSYVSQLYMEIDSLNLAKSYLVEANLMAPGWGPVLQAKARFYRKTGEIAQSIAEGKKALANDASDPVNYLILAQSYLAADKADSARRYSFEGLKLTGFRDPMLLLLHGKLLVKAGKEDSAVAVYKKALTISPNQQKINKELGEIYTRRGEFKDAVQAYSNYLRNYPSDTMVYLKQGYCFERLGEWNKAQELYVKASVRFPTHKGINEAKERVVNMLTRSYSSPVL
jgi:tetratricopeptide (TPR) repeat protein